MTRFIEVTRVYKKKDAAELLTQKVTIDANKLESIRPSNRLGYPEHRTTIVMASGVVYDLAETYSQVRSKLASA